VPPTTRIVTAVLAWAAAVVGATAIGLTAVGAIGAGIVGPDIRPLDAAEVQRRLSATPAAAPASPAPSVPPAADPPAGTATPVVLGGPGGTVLARCTGGGVEIVSASPAQGFGVHDEGGEDGGRVRFESERTEVEMQIGCVDGRPVAETTVEDD
jgi:hypothetical protein